MATHSSTLARPRRGSLPPADDEFSGGVGAFAVMNGRLAETSAGR